jgi:hypothetical protein
MKFDNYDEYDEDPIETPLLDKVVSVALILAAVLFIAVVAKNVANFL